ncbi:MAG: PEP-CTERM sorting domain-containing protein [Planctomycetales bacterium]|nr:PEP-CTERM sorting domain-containing protein [Planctomycetales bacterium]
MSLNVPVWLGWRRGGKRSLLSAVCTTAWLVAAACPTSARPVDVVFALDPARSSLEVTAGVSILQGSDGQSLFGTIDASLDFGDGSRFPNDAAVTVTNADISPTNNFLITIPFTASISITDAVADVSTINPPAAMSRIAGSGVVYQFDSADFLVSLNRGTVTATGLASAMFDLEDMPVSDSAPPGSYGTIQLATITSEGPYRLIDAVMTLPVEITNVVDFNGLAVNVVASGVVVANASFVIALPAIATDFDGDLDVDGADLAVWQQNYGLASGATPATGDADADGAVNGGDFLQWQRDFGLTPPSAALAAVPEPATLLLSAVGGILFLVARSRAR